MTFQPHLKLNSLVFADTTPVKRPSVEDRILPKKELLCSKDRDNLILQSIEYYFSDENLSKNAYLLKQVIAVT